jgi:kynurenine formamidase
MIPLGYEGVDPRTATRVPLWQELGADVPLFPGDPPFTVETWTTIAESGYLLEHVTSLGTHTGTHISAPAHFVAGGTFLSGLDESWALMPLAVIDVRERAAAADGGGGGGFSLTAAEVRAWERGHGRFPAGGCVLLLTGWGQRFGAPAYFDPAPGFAAEAVAWLFERRGVIAVGSDTFGPDAAGDSAFGATGTALGKGGITVENVGPGLARMRPFGDWVSVNGPRARCSGFPTGITGFTLG